MEIKKYKVSSVNIYAMYFGRILNAFEKYISHSSGESKN